MKNFRLFKNALLTTAAFALLIAAPKAQARTYTSEKLSYQIVYHWGMIWKHAGNATLSIKRNGADYKAELVCWTRSWADKIYPLRDTLRVSMNKDFTPIKYEKATHEKGKYAYDVVKFTKSGGSTQGSCARVRPKKETQYVNLTTPGNAYDMLSVFYMLRDLDFAKMTKNQTVKTVVFSGKKKENLSLTYKGIETIKMRDGTKHEAYRIGFRFTQDGGKKSSDNLDAWLSTGPSCIPLMLVGKLPIGEVKCYYGAPAN